MRHTSQHGSSPDGDALDLWESQDKLLLDLFAEWESDSNGRWERGTIGKLLLEHAAVREGVITDIAAGLTGLGDETGADDLMADSLERRKILDQLDGESSGREPAAINANASFAEAATALRSRLGKDITRDLTDTIPRLRQSIDEEARAEAFHSARYVRKHAPSHPNPKIRWYNQLAGIKRLHTVYDRLRGFPWPESKPIMDEELANKYDQEA